MEEDKVKFVSSDDSEINADNSVNFQSADETNASKYFSVAEDESTLENISDADFCTPTGKSSHDAIDADSYDERLGSVASADIFDDNESSVDGHELVIDDDPQPSVKSDDCIESAGDAGDAGFEFDAEDAPASKSSDLDPSTKTDSKSEDIQTVANKSDPIKKEDDQCVEENDVEVKTESYNFPEGSHRVTLLIDGNNVEAINIGQDIYIYNDANGDLTAFQVLKEDGNLSIKHLLVGKNEDGNIEVYEEQINQITVPAEDANSKDKEAPKIIESPVKSEQNLMSESDVSSEDLIKAVMEQERSMNNVNVDNRNLSIINSSICSEKSPVSDISKPTLKDSSMDSKLTDPKIESEISRTSFETSEDNFSQNGRDLNSDAIDVLDGESQSEIPQIEKNESASLPIDTPLKSEVEKCPQDEFFEDDVGINENINIIDGDDESLGISDKLSVPNAAPDEKFPQSQDFIFDFHHRVNDSPSIDSVLSTAVDNNVINEDVIRENDAEKDYDVSSDCIQTKIDNLNTSIDTTENKQLISNDSLNREIVLESVVEKNDMNIDIDNKNLNLDLNMHLDHCDLQIPDEKDEKLSNIKYDRDKDSANHDDNQLKENIEMENKNLNTEVDIAIDEEDKNLISKVEVCDSVVIGESPSVTVDDNDDKSNDVCNNIPSDLNTEVDIAIDEEDKHLVISTVEVCDSVVIGESPSVTVDDNDDKSNDVCNNIPSNLNTEVDIAIHEEDKHIVISKVEVCDSVVVDESSLVTVDGNNDKFDDICNNMPSNLKLEDDVQSVNQNLKNQEEKLINEEHECDLKQSLTFVEKVVDDGFLIDSKENVDLCKSPKLDNCEKNDDDLILQMEIPDINKGNFNNIKDNTSEEEVFIDKEEESLDMDKSENLVIDLAENIENQEDFVENKFSIVDDTNCCIELDYSNNLEDVSRKDPVITLVNKNEEIVDDLQASTESDDEFDEYVEGEPVTGDSGIDWSDGNITNSDKTAEEQVSQTEPDINQMESNSPVEESLPPEDHIVIDNHEDHEKECDFERSVDGIDEIKDLVVDLDEQRDLENVEETIHINSNSIEDSKSENETIDTVLCQYEKRVQNDAKEIESTEKLADSDYSHNHSPPIIRTQIIFENIESKNYENELSQDIGVLKTSIDNSSKKIEIENRSLLFEELISGNKTIANDAGKLLNDTVHIEIQNDIDLILDSKKVEVTTQKSDSNSYALSIKELDKHSLESDPIQVYNLCQNDAFSNEQFKGFQPKNAIKTYSRETKYNSLSTSNKIVSPSKCVVNNPIPSFNNESPKILKKSTSVTEEKKDVNFSSLYPNSSFSFKPDDTLIMEISPKSKSRQPRKQIFTSVSKSDIEIFFSNNDNFKEERNSFHKSPKTYSKLKPKDDTEKISSYKIVDNVQKEEGKKVYKEIQKVNKVNSVESENIQLDTNKINKDVDFKNVDENVEDINITSNISNSSSVDENSKHKSEPLPNSAKRKRGRPKKNLCASISLHTVISDMDNNVIESSNESQKEPEKKSFTAEENQIDSDTLDTLVVAFKENENSGSKVVSETGKRKKGRPRKILSASFDHTNERTLVVENLKRKSLSNLEVYRKSDENMNESSTLLTLNKNDENICPICSKNFRSANVLLKHAKHCNGIIDPEAFKSPKRKRLEIHMDDSRKNDDEKSHSPNIVNAELENSSSSTNHSTCEESLKFEDEFDISESGDGRVNNNSCDIVDNSIDSDNTKALDLSISAEKSNTTSVTENKTSEIMEISKMSNDKVIVIDDDPEVTCVDLTKNKSDDDKNVDFKNKNKPDDDEDKSDNPKTVTKIPRGRPAKKIGLENKTSPMSRLSKFLNTKPPINKVIKCEICGKTFRQLAHMVYHRNKHSTEKSKDQNVTANNVDRKSVEEPQKPEVDVAILKCEVCKKGFRKLHHLVEHREVHNNSQTKTRRTSINSVKSEPEAFRCDTCDKSFRKLHHLVVHRECHISETNDDNDAVEVKEDTKPVEKEDATCTGCGKSFRKRHHMVEHRDIHCSPLKKRNSHDSEVSENNVRLSFASTTSEESNNCGICGKSYRKLYHMVEHRESHVEYNSKLLHYRTSTRMSTTESLNTKDIIHECPKCYMVFPNVKALNKHMQFCLRKKTLRKPVLNQNSTQIPQINKRASMRTKSDSSTNESLISTTRASSVKSQMAGIDQKPVVTKNPAIKTKLPSSDTSIVAKKPKLEASSRDEDDNVRYKINTNYKLKPSFKTKIAQSPKMKTILEDTTVRYSFPKTPKPTEKNAEKRFTRRSINVPETSIAKKGPQKTRSSLITKPKINNNNNAPSLAIKRRSLGGRKSLDGKKLVGRSEPKNRPNSVNVKKTKNDAKKTFKCDCGKQFDNDVQLRKHMDSEHTPPKSFKCQKCGVSVRTAVQFARHKKTHDGDSRGTNQSTSVKTKSPRKLLQAKTKTAVSTEDAPKKRKAAHSGVPLTEKMRKALSGSKFTK